MGLCLVSLSESPLKYGLIYAGTDDGRLHRTKDGGNTWTEIIKGVVPGKWISRVEASRFDMGTVYMSQNGKRDDDFQVYVWKSNDFGTTWKDISGNIPIGPVNVVREDPMDKNIIYVGADIGVWHSADSGTSWNPLQNGLPDAPVFDLQMHPSQRLLRAATHGRGVYELRVD